ncbi:MAG: hypothetical protein HRT88_03525 [Lentisphaeraceae bacterium]|nr:hypothetical protein [Lentisphaeraceae bacterium]
MQDAKRVNFLVWMMFLLSIVTSLCLGMMSYTLFTGELPFELRQHELFQDYTFEAPPKIEKAAIIPIDIGSRDELALRTLSRELNNKVDELAKREVDLTAKEELFDALQKSVNDAQDKVTAAVNALDDKKAMNLEAIQKADKALDDKMEKFQLRFDEAQSERVKKVASTLEAMKPSTAMHLLADFDVPEAANLLLNMTEAKRSAIISEMIEGKSIGDRKLNDLGVKKFRDKARELMFELRKLKE